MPVEQPEATARPAPEFIALVALTMSMVALSIDAMLPALGDISRELGAANPNDRQLVITTFFVGLTAGIAFWGPISDSAGRKPTLFVSIALYAAGGLLSALSGSFTLMLLGRTVQGVGAAGPRIVALAMVRDLYAGRRMASVMSFVTSVLILVPILAPSVGQLVLLVAPWRAIFFVLVAVALIDGAWLALRQPETLPRARRVRFSLRTIARGVIEALTTRVTFGYTLGTGLVFGAFISYLGSSQQIFQELYGLGRLFPVYFAILAASLGVASIVNARLVMRFGMRTLSKWALRADCALSAACLLAFWAAGGRPPLWAFMAYMMGLFFSYGLLFGNYNARAMEPMGHIAGVAAAVIGSLGTTISLVVGTPIGRAYDGTVLPMVAGSAALGVGALLCTEWAERGRAALPA